MYSAKSLVVVLALACGTLASGQTANAAVGSFVIRNPSGVYINYQVKWGEGEWKSFTLAPGWSNSHYYPLDENGQVPTPYVRFDYICGDNETTWKTYRMDVYATNYPANGKKYVFRHSPDGIYLDLYSE